MVKSHLDSGINKEQRLKILGFFVHQKEGKETDPIVTTKVKR